MTKKISSMLFYSHFPEKVSKEICEYVRDTVLKHSRYLFYKTVAGVQIAYCTHCNSEFRSAVRLKHKQHEVCPKCNSQCQVRAAGISRKNMVDRAVFVWYEKSQINPEAITARILAVLRDYRDDFRNVETQYHIAHMYVFEPGATYHFEYGRPRKTVYSGFDTSYSSGSWQKFVSEENIRKAVQSTPFEYSTWEQYRKYPNTYYVSDMVEFFDLAARFPCIEYLTKSGFQRFVFAKLMRERTYGAINWRGKTLQSVLRLGKMEIRELHEHVKSKKDFGLKHLQFYQQHKKAGKTLSFRDAHILGDAIESLDTYPAVVTALQYATMDVIEKYILKQVTNSVYNDVTMMLYDWRDYQEECHQLGMDLAEARYLFPNNLRKAHEKTSQQVKMKNDQELNRKIEKRLPEIEEKYRYRNGKYLIRPARSCAELFYEGNRLNHCVGRYAEQYAKAECDILFIRHVNSPNTPFFTMEVVRNNVRQCRGMKNRDMTDEVKTFVDRFVAEKLTTKKQTRVNKKSREAVAI